MNVTKEKECVDNAMGTLLDNQNSLIDVLDHIEDDDDIQNIRESTIKMIVERMSRDAEIMPALIKLCSTQTLTVHEFGKIRNYLVQDAICADDTFHTLMLWYSRLNWSDKTVCTTFFDGASRLMCMFSSE